MPARPVSNFKSLRNTNVFLRQETHAKVKMAAKASGISISRYIEAIVESRMDRISHAMQTLVQK